MEAQTINAEVVSVQEQPRRMSRSQMRLLPFAFEDTLVRIWEDEAGNPWFVARDVCRALELENVTEATRALDEDEMFTFRISDGNPRAGIPHQLMLISESGMYTLIFRSRKPQAKTFSRWVRHEVLPGIRRSGYYRKPGTAGSVPPEALRLPRDKRLSCLRMAVQLCTAAAQPDRVEEIYARLCAQIADVGEVAPEAGPITPAAASLSLEGQLRAFIRDNLVSTPGTRLPSRRFFESFCRWLDAQGRLSPSLSIKRVTQTVRRARLLPIAYNAPSVMFGDVSLRNPDTPAWLPLA